MRIPQNRSRLPRLPSRRKNGEGRTYDTNGRFVPHVGRGSNTLERFAAEKPALLLAVEPAANDDPTPPAEAAA